MPKRLFLPFRIIRAAWRSITHALFPVQAWEPILFLVFFYIYGFLGLNVLKHSGILEETDGNAGSYLGYDNLFHLYTNGGALDISHPFFNVFHILKWAVAKCAELVAGVDIRTVFCILLMNLLVSGGLVLLFRYLRRIVLLPLSRALLLTFLAAGSFTTIILSFTTESYPFSFFLLILSLLVLSWEYKMRRSFNTYTLTVFTFLLGGVTISNAGKPLLASLVGILPFREKLRNIFKSLFPFLVCVVVVFVFYSLKSFFDPETETSPAGSALDLLQYFRHDELFAHALINDFWANTFMTTPLSLQFVGHEQVLRPTIYLHGWQYAVPYILLLLCLASVFLNVRKNPYVQILSLYFVIDLFVHVGLGYGMDEAVLFGGHFLFLVPMLIGWLYRKLPKHTYKTLDITLLILLFCIVTFNSMELNRLWSLISY